MHDFAVISLSDLMTPLDTIRRRLEAAAQADFVVALYNPRSKGRVTQIEEARQILIAARGPQVPVGIVRNACRSGETPTLKAKSSPDRGVLLSTNLSRFDFSDIALRANTRAQAQRSLSVESAKEAS
jgi:hypothetical protein